MGNRAKALGGSACAFGCNPRIWIEGRVGCDRGQQCKDLSTVEAEWRQAVTANPKSYEAHVGLSGRLSARGSDKLREAEDEAKTALALDPARIDSYRLLAAIYVTTARWDQLDAALRSARSAVPDDLTAGQTILDSNILKKPSEGLEPMAMAHWKLGVSLEREGHKSAALNELEIAVSLGSTLDEWFQADVGSLKSQSTLYVYWIRENRLCALQVLEVV
jgi:tetratricopeptide (TPR) repeat protein